MTSPIPSPGSPDARSRGCKCDSRKNKRGVGAYVDGLGKTRYVVKPDCSVHGPGSAWAKGEAT